MKVVLYCPSFSQLSYVCVQTVRLVKGLNETLVLKPLVLTHWREHWKGSCALILIHPCGIPNGLKTSLSAALKAALGNRFQSNCKKRNPK